MARLVVATALVSVLLSHPRAVAAEDLLAEDDVAALAIEAGVDEVELLGAADTTRLSPRQYLAAVGEYPQRPPPTLPVLLAPSVAARVACIEGKESGGANVPNSRGSGAGGVLQYMESTFRAHAAEMGHPEWSRWVPEQARAVAAHDLSMGRRAQWTVPGC